MSLYDNAINHFLEIITKFKRRFGSDIVEPKHEIECIETQEEIKWNNSKGFENKASTSSTKQHHCISTEKPTEIIITKLKQLEERLFKIENRST